MTRMDEDYDLNPIAGHLFACKAAFLQQLRTYYSFSQLLAYLTSTLPAVAVLAWMARESDSQIVVAYVTIGSFMLTVWQSGVFRVGWTLTEELTAGTLQFNLLSRSPVMWVIFGKALALISLGSIAGVMAVLVVLAITQDPPGVAQVGLLVVSVMVTLVAVTITAFLFAPLMVLSKGQAGFTGAITPFGTVFSSFLYPVGQLPEALEYVARALPTSWAMESIILSTQGGGSYATVIARWGIALGIAAGWLGITAWMFRKVEQRLRVTGELTA